MIRVTPKALKPGDVFRIPVGDSYFAFARIMFRTEKSCCLIEVFTEKNQSGEFSEEILQGPRLMPIQNIAPTEMMSQRWQWKVVFRDENYETPIREVESTEFFAGGEYGGECHLKSFIVNWNPEVDEMRYRMRRVPIEEGKRHERWDNCWNPTGMIQRIRKHLHLEPNEWENEDARWEWFLANGIAFE